MNDVIVKRERKEAVKTLNGWELTYTDSGKPQVRRAGVFPPMGGFTPERFAMLKAGMSDIETLLADGAKGANAREIERLKALLAAAQNKGE